MAILRSTYSFAVVFLWEWGLIKVIKSAKINEIYVGGAGFGFYKGLVVVVRGGCGGGFGEVRFIICDHEKSIAMVSL